MKIVDCCWYEWYRWLFLLSWLYCICLCLDYMVVWWLYIFWFFVIILLFFDEIVDLFCVFILCGSLDLSDFIFNCVFFLLVWVEVVLIVFEIGGSSIGFFMFKVIFFLVGFVYVVVGWFEFIGLWYFLIGFWIFWLRYFIRYFMFLCFLFGILGR